MKVNLEIGNIQVTNIENSSGLFISQTNYANGWRSQLKTNSGFGEAGDNNTFENCVIVVSDDDFIDSPMVDNSILIENNKKMAETVSTIHFKQIEVNTLFSNAAIAVGENTQPGWASKVKNNNGNGEFVGDTVMISNKNILKDNDFVDTPLNDYHIVKSG